MCKFTDDDQFRLLVSQKSKTQIFQNPTKSKIKTTKQANSQISKRSKIQIAKKHNHQFPQNSKTQTAKNPKNIIAKTGRYFFK